MGWLFNTHPQPKGDFIEEILGYNFGPSSGFTLLDHCVRGGRLWVLVQPHGREPQIALFLLERDRGGCWGYKDLDESMGPLYYDCPLRWLDQAPEPSWCYVDGHLGSRRTWRDFVREHHAQQAANRKRTRPPVGSTIQLGDTFCAPYAGSFYRVTEDLGRRGLMLNGRIRLKSRQIKGVQIVTPAAPASA